MTSILATAVAIVVIFYLRLQRHLSVAFLTIVIGIALAFAIAQSSLPDVMQSVTGKDTTLTGRTAIWGLVAEKIGERPILGYGYGAFWNSEADSVNGFLNGFKPGQAHNGYLEVCLDLGILGLIACLLIVLGGAMRALRLNRLYGSRTGDWMLVVIAILLIHNVGESDIMLDHIMWFIFMVTSFSCWQKEVLLYAETAEEAPIQTEEDFVAA
jgi:O-antigen ligase